MSHLLAPARAAFPATAGASALLIRLQRLARSPRNAAEASQVSLEARSRLKRGGPFPKLLGARI